MPSVRFVGEGEGEGGEDEGEDVVGNDDRAAEGKGVGVLKQGTPEYAVNKTENQMYVRLIRVSFSA